MSKKCHMTNKTDTFTGMAVTTSKKEIIYNYVAIQKWSMVKAGCGQTGKGAYINCLQKTIVYQLSVYLGNNICEYVCGVWVCGCVCVSICD